MPFRAIHIRAIIEAIVLVCLAAFLLNINFTRRHDNPASAISSDVKGYYMYLPAVFVYKNIHSLPDENFQGRNKNEKGESYTKYSCGIAYCYLPFFLIAHAYAHLTHGDTSGFSAPYDYAIMIGGEIWVLIGLFLLKNLLSRYFSVATTWITLLSIVFATNFFNYASLDVGMSHIYDFTLFAGAILATDQYYKTPRKGLAILIGILMAWVVLARPTNFAMVIFLVLYRVTSKAELKARMRFLKQHAGDILLMLPFALLLVLPQMWYWKEMTGHWIKYSYEGEGFIYWSNPKIASVLFDTANGLFPYSPALLFMLWALVARRKDPRTSFAGVTIVFAMITYFFASWWAWGFGGAYGHRCYVDFLPMFAFPLAVTIERIMQTRNKFVIIPTLLVLLLFGYYTYALCERYYAVDGYFDGPQWSWNWNTWFETVKKKL